MGDDERLSATLQNDPTHSEAEGLIEIYKRQRPGEPPTEESARSLLNSLFFDKRYDLARVGRYKFNKKLAIRARIRNHVAADTIVHPVTGEILVEAGQTIDRFVAGDIQNAGINEVWLLVGDNRVKVIGNNFVRASDWLEFDPREAGINEDVHLPTLKATLKDAEGMSQDELKALLKSRYYDLIPRHIIPDDMIASRNNFV